MSQSQPVAGPDLPAEAEYLLRSLAGVADARVHASHTGTGIEAIHIDVTDPDLASMIAAHARSALLAGLATPVVPARIHVRVLGQSGQTEPTPRHRLRLVQEAETGPATAKTPVREPAGEEALVTRRPRLVAVDLDRSPDGRVLCTATVAYRTDVYRADANAVDLPGAAAQAAAQATVRALKQAGLDGLELDGLREIEIAGRDYVLVALRRAGHYTRVRSGSAPVSGTPERAAATATVDAARKLT